MFNIDFKNEANMAKNTHNTNQMGFGVVVVVVYSSTLCFVVVGVCQLRQFKETCTKPCGRTRHLKGGKKQKSEAKPLYLTKFYLIWFYYSLTSRYLCTHCQAHTHMHVYTKRRRSHWTTIWSLAFRSLSPHSSFTVVLADAAVAAAVAAWKAD